MQLDVHALKRLLHVLHMAGSRSDVICTQALVILKLSNMRWRHKPCLQQTVRMQGSTPLTVLHVSLTPGQVACLPSVDHHHFKASRFEYTIERQPVDPGSFHCYGVDTFSQQPIAQFVQLAGKRPKNLWQASSDGNMHMLAAHITEGCPRIENR